MTTDRKALAEWLRTEASFLVRSMEHTNLRAAADIVDPPQGSRPTLALLESVVSIESLLVHHTEKSQCDACKSFDALQDAAMVTVAELDRLRASNAELMEALKDLRWSMK